MSTGISILTPAPPPPSDTRKRIVSALDSLPPFSPVVRQLLASMALDEDRISLPSIANLMEQDTLIAGRVLGIANSPFYGRGHEITSVRLAVARLGLYRLRNVVLALSINRICGNLHAPSDFSISRFNLHSQATATAAEIIGQEIACEHAEQAFLAGLFHDVGELLLILAYPREYATLLKRAPLAGEELEEAERFLFGVTHPEVSAEATAYWNLPEAIQTAVLFHERPREEDMRKAGFSLSEALHAADQYADVCGFSFAGCESLDDVSPETILPRGVLDKQIRPVFVQQITVMRAMA